MKQSVLHRRTATVVALASALAVLAACNRSATNRRHTSVLRRDLRAVCDSGLRSPYWLSLRINGAYVVNGERMDSATLNHWLNDQVRGFPTSRRRLVILNNPARSAELTWIVRLAGQADVTVYEFLPRDSVCYPPIR
jgi:hypothetical protein